MGAYLGLDIGDKRIGISVSYGGLMADGVETYTRTVMASDVDYICALAEHFKANVLVAGLPRHLDGSPHEQAQKNETLLDRLRERGYTVDYMDERLTSAAAERAMLEADLSRKKRKKNIDKLAAVIILQDYLDRRNGG